MFYSGILTEPSRKEVEMREAASLRQQRRMKQAVQFIHKDSADLLPLDGLKKLGTSKDTQPHNILQRRLMETNLTKLRNNRGTWTPKNDISAQTNKLNQTKPDNPKKKEEEDLILVCCQVSVFLHTRKWTMSTALKKCIIFQLTVLSHTTDIIAVLQNKGSSRLKNTAVTLGDPNCAGKDMKAVIDTSCQYNLLSSACLDRLGLKEHIKTYKTEGEKISLPCNMKVIGQIEHLAVTVGTIHVDCSAVVTEENEKNFSLGLQTLKSLKCVINMEKHYLVLGKTEREEIPFVDNNISTNGENSSEE